MQKLGFTLPSKVYEDLPVEDSYSYIQSNCGLIVGIADGITRDPIGLKVLPDKDEARLKLFSQAYPRPSPAKIAADLFCRTFVDSLLRKDIQGRDGVREAFESANYEIRKLNMGREIDYLENDFAACVASGGVIIERILYFAYIGDCGVAVIDAKGNLKYRTKDDVKRVSLHLNSLDKNWREPSWRMKVRMSYRNKPSEPNSYGSLTGEEEAMGYVRTGILKVEKRDFVLFYSDGMEELIFYGNPLNQTFLKHLRGYGLSGLEDVCKKISKKLELK